MALAHVTHYTDPGCPYAWNSEPFLRHLEWRYGEQLEWSTVMVGLAETAEEYETKGLTTGALNESWKDFADNYGMPIDATPRDRVGGTGHGCRAVVAAQLHAPEKADGLLRALRVSFFSGGFLDQDETIRQAAGWAGIDADALLRWMEGDDVSSIYADQMQKARHPSPEALAQDARLAEWTGGRRYTCPSLEVARPDGARLSAPGYQLWKSYELLLANLIPDADQRPDAESVGEVIEWADHPLATAEVAQLRGITREQARDELQVAGATEHAMGSDSLWTN